MIPDNGLQAAWPTEPAGSPRPRKTPLDFLRSMTALVLMAFAVALIMKTFLLQMFFIPSGSMEPTLHGCTGCDGDRVAVNKFVYRFREPRRGEIIVFVAHEDTRDRSFIQRVGDFLSDGLGVTRPQEEDFIKRVIGLPGETVRVTKKAVFITRTDGARLRLKEPYTQIDGGEIFNTFGPFTVPDDSYFVMGDNRNNSSDSRSSLGPIPRDRIIGRAFVKIWPLKRIGQLDKPNYKSSRLTAAGSGEPATGAGADRASPDPEPLAIPFSIPVLAAMAGVMRRR